MAIEYTKISEKYEKWGIDVTVRFTDKGVDMTKTFRFDDSKQIEQEFESRMTKAITNIENRIINEDKKPTPIDIYEELEKHFEKNETISKEDFETIKNTELTVGGGVIKFNVSNFGSNKLRRPEVLYLENVKFGGSIVERKLSTSDSIESKVKEYIERNVIMEH